MVCFFALEARAQGLFSAEFRIGDTVRIQRFEQGTAPFDLIGGILFQRKQPLRYASFL